MRAINHALTGASIGVLVRQPELAIPAALISHYICDIIPHYGSGAPEEDEISSVLFKRLLIIDFFLCVTLVVILAILHPISWQLASLCAFIAASPDLLSAKRFLTSRRHKLPRPNAYIRFAKNIQLYEKPPGAIVEIVWFSGALVILYPFLNHR